MSISSQLSALRTDIENARTVITNKGGTVTSGGGSSQLATDIATIPAGTVNNQDKTITQNGVYTADLGYSGLGTVTVNVSGGDQIEVLNNTGGTVNTGDKVWIDKVGDKYIAYPYNEGDEHTFTGTATSSAEEGGTFTVVTVIPVISTVSLTVNPTPSDANVELSTTASSYKKSGNSITVDPGSSVSYTVSKTGYISSSNTLTLNENKIINVTLDENLYKVTFYINPTSGTIYANGSTLSNGGSIHVQSGSTVEFYAETENGTLGKATTTITEDNTVIYIVDKKTETSDESTYTISGSKEISVPVSHNTETEQYSVKIDPTTDTVTYKVNGEVVEEDTLLLVTFNVTPSDSTIEINGSTIKFDELRVAKDTTIDYTVSKEGYVSVSGSRVIVSATTITVNLAQDQVVSEYYSNYTPSENSPEEGDVTLTDYTGTDTNVVVPTNV